MNKVITYEEMIDNPPLDLTAAEEESGGCNAGPALGIILLVVVVAVMIGIISNRH